MNVSKTKYTKAELMLFLYDIPFSFVAKLFEREEVKRKYKLLFKGNYQRVDLNVLKNICSFLNVTTGVVLDGAIKNDVAKVYIKNINAWIDFDVYILLRSTGMVEDVFVKEVKTIEHNVLFEYVSYSVYERIGFNSLIKYATAQFTTITDPKKIHVKGDGMDNYCHNKEKYFIQIKPYLMKFMDEKSFEFKLVGMKAMLEDYNN